MKLQRREFLGGVSAAVLTACGKASTGGVAEASPPPIPSPSASPIIDVAQVDADLVDAFLAEGLTEGDPLKPPPKETVDSWADLDKDPDLMNRAKRVVARVASGDLVAKVPEDPESPDNFHFVSPDFGKDGEIASGSFLITDAVLRGVMKSNGFGAAVNFASSPLVLFGVRGCMLKGGENASTRGEAIEVHEAAVDHVRRRCVIGVWDTKTGMIEAFAGSTVPNLVNMQYYVYWRYSHDGYVKDPKKKWTQAPTMACLLPQGLHAFRVGVHLRSEPKARRQPGALLQSVRTPILRSASDVGYTIRSEWDPLHWKPEGEPDAPRLVGVNIHAGVNRNMPPYASKGCQTIYGWYDKGVTPQGLWSKFQAAIGVSVKEEPSGEVSFTKAGVSFPYLLTCGRAVRLQAAAKDDPTGLAALQRIRLGSKGEGAAKARTFLSMQPGSKLKAGDAFDGDAMLAMLQWQKANDLPCDGVVTPELSKTWGIDAI